MLKRTHRFHGRGGPRSVYRRGRTVRGPWLSLKFTHQPRNRPYKVAVVVSRKVSKSAVVRNRIRRRIFEVVRRSETPPPPGSELVFTVFNEQLANAQAAKLQASVEDLLRKMADQIGAGSQHPERS